ncbi:MAG: cation:proton antiporter [Elusimicrobiota bacterium]|nr:cation:proton antiporter [Elusimicrobiota bacterium]
MSTVLIGLGLLVFGAHLFRAVFQRTRIPDVLPFFLLGLLIGPLLGWVSPEAFGSLDAVFTSVVLVVILFEGGLNLKLKDIADSMSVGARLTVISFAASLLLMPLLLKPLLGFSWVEGLLAGAILGGTSSAVVIPMAASLPLSEKTRTGLFLESSLSDVICIVVTLSLAATISSPEVLPGRVLGQILASFLLAVLIGGAGGLAWSAILDRVHDLEHSLSTTPAFMLIIYGVAEGLGYSGAIAALAFGVALGNIRDLPLGFLKGFTSFSPVTVSDTEREVYAEVVFIAKAFFFIYIGLQIKGSSPVLWGVALLATVLIYAARIAVVRLSFDAATPRDDVSTASALAPKGLAAAVLAAVPLRAGFTHGKELEATVYGVVLCSILLTSTLVFLLRGGAVREAYRSLFRGYAENEPA